jgi:Tol biopolymer transport system component
MSLQMGLPFRARVFPALIILLGLAFGFPSLCGAAGKRPGRIAFIGTDDQVYTCTGDCAKPQCVTCPSHGLQVRGPSALHPVRWIQEVPEFPQAPPSRQRPSMRYGWPTFSPDGSKLAFSWEGQGPDGNRFGISVYDLARQETIPIFASRTERIDYVLWTHDSKKVSFLVNEPQGLSLILAEIKEKAPVRLIMTGVPLYYAWNQAGDRLVVHTNREQSMRGEHVALLNVTPTSQEVIKRLSRGRSPFKTPCWSPDGKHLAYVASDNAESYLVVADADGSNPKSMVSLAVGESSFIWAPDSRHIAYSTAIIGAEMVFQGIKSLDTKTGESRRLSSEEVQAFFYSPDSQYLAFIAAPPKLPFYVWYVVDLKSGKTRKLGNFLATQEESIAYHYFDQLALSHNIWAPDSSAFVYAGVRLLRAPSSQGGPAPAPQLWIVPVDGSDPQAGIGATQAYYSPAGG